MLLYIHIPYCDSKCYYCNFNSYVDRFNSRVDYMKALKIQLEYELNRFSATENSIESIFIGGGTPSTIKASLYKEIFKLLSTYQKKNIEITIEANPNSATYNWLSEIYDLGVNRVSFGVQSFSNQKLKELNRTHLAKDAIRTINDSYNIGFKNISLDLIYDYKGDTKDSLKKDIDMAFNLPINHISAYELTIEKGTKFYNISNIKANNIELGRFIANEIIKKGFTQYEISNFGKYQSFHNKGYWQLKNYIGIGAGAVGFLKNKRFYPHTDIEQFIKNPTNNQIEYISNNELLMERIFLGFRSNIGIDSRYLNSNIKSRCEFLVKEKKLIKKDNFYINLDFFIADEISLYVLD